MKRERIKRCLALILSFVMLFTSVQSPLMVNALEFEESVNDVFEETTQGEVDLTAWPVEIGASNLSEGAFVQARKLDPANEADANLLVYLQNQTVNGVIDAYELSLQNGYVTSTDGSVIAMFNTPVPENAVLMFYGQNGVQEIPVDVDAANVSCAFTAPELYMDYNPFIAFCTPAVQELVEDVQEPAQNAGDVELVEPDPQNEVQSNAQAEIQSDVQNETLDKVQTNTQEDITSDLTQNQETQSVQEETQELVQGDAVQGTDSFNEEASLTEEITESSVSTESTELHEDGETGAVQNDEIVENNEADDTNENKADVEDETTIASGEVSSEENTEEKKDVLDAVSSNNNAVQSEAVEPEVESTSEDIKDDEEKKEEKDEEQKDVSSEETDVENVEEVNTDEFEEEKDVVIDMLALGSKKLLGGPLRAPATTSAQTNPDWYLDYTYTLDTSNHTISLKKYNGSDAVVIVPGSVEINGDTYTVHTVYNSSSQGLFSENTSIEKVVFENGVVVENARYMFLNASNLKEVDLSASDCSSLVDMQGMFSRANALQSLKFSYQHNNSASINTLDMFGASATAHPCMFTEFDMGGLDFSNAYLDGGNRYVDVSKTEKIVLHEDSSPVNNGGSSFLCAPAYYQWENEDTGVILTSQELFNNYDGSTMAGTWLNRGISAVLYTDGTLVIQNGFDFDETYGEIYKTYRAANVTYDGWHWYRSAPKWLADKTNIRSVVVSEGVCSDSLAYWFQNCSNLTSVDLSGFDSSILTDVRFMFDGCSKLQTLDISMLDMRNILYHLGGFLPGNSLLSLTLGEYNVLSNEQGSVTLPNHDWINQDTGLVYTASTLVSTYDGSTMAGTYTDASPTVIMYDSGEMVFQRGTLTDPTKGNVLRYWTNFQDNRVGNCWEGNDNAIIADRKKITKISIAGPFAPTSMYQWFSNFPNLTSIEGLEKIDTSNVTSMDSLFSGCSSLTSLDLSSFDTGNVTSFGYMFYNCSSLEEVDLSSFNTENGTGFRAMFCGCTSLAELDIGSFDMSKATDTEYFLKTNTYSGSSYSACIPVKRLMFSDKTKFYGTSDNGLELSGNMWLNLSTGEKLTGEEILALYSSASATAPSASAINATYLICMNVVFNGNGGVSSEATRNYPYGLAFGNDPLPTATRRGYTFDGWYTAKNGGDRVTAETLVTFDKLYAHWTPIEYTLVLDPNGAEGEPVEVTLKYNESYTLPKNTFTLNGYKIKQWNTKSNGRGVGYYINDDVIMLSSTDGDTVTLYAVYEANGHIVTFDSQGGSSVKSVEVVDGAKIGQLYNSAKTDYTFLGWFTEAEGGEQITENTIIKDDVTFYAHWIKNPVVTFHTNGGDSDNIIRKYSYNSALGILPTPLREGYSFIGYFTDPENGEEISRNTKAIEDVTFYAHWGKEVVFNPQGGTITQQADSYHQMIDEEDCETYVIDSLPVVKKDGYTLTGWFDVPDGETGNEITLGSTVNLLTNNTFYAHWTPKNSVSVTLDPNGGSLTLTEIQVYEGEEVTSLPTPTRTGCLFDGWYSEAEGGNPITASSTFSADTTIYAHWTQDNTTSHTVTFYRNGGTSIKGENDDYSMTVKDGETIQDIPGASYSGKVLEGWYPNNDGTGDKLTKATVIDSDKTYYANWIDPKVTKSENGIDYWYRVYWSNSSTADVDNEDNHLNFHPSTPQTLEATMHLEFELSQAVDTTLPAGSIAIRIPKYVFKNWSGNWTQFSTDIVTYMNNNLPQYPEARTGVWFSYQTDGNDIVLLNNTDISGGAGISIDIPYSIFSSDVPGGAQDNDGEYLGGYPYYDYAFNVPITIDTDNDNTADITENIPLSVEAHTFVNTEQAKSYHAIHYMWDSKWGQRPADDADCFYIEWFTTLTDNNSTQPYTAVFSEETVHDGTVAYQNGSRIVTKHPNSILEEAGEDGVTLHNEAILIKTWNSGYVETDRVSADTTVYSVQFNPGTASGSAFSTGTFQKENFNGSSTASVINGGQEDIVDDQNQVSMSYYLNASCCSYEEPMWDDENETYISKTHSVVIEDGVKGDVMYSSGLAENKYEWVPDTGNVTLGDNDYSIESINFTLYEYDAVKEGNYWYNETTHTPRTDYSPVEVWIRERGSDDFYLYRTVDALNTSTSITFPLGTVGYRLKHDSDFYKTQITINSVLKLKPSIRVQTLLYEDMKEGAVSLIKNQARCYILDESGTTRLTMTNRGEDDDNAGGSEYELNISSTYLEVGKSKGSVTSNATKGIQTVPMTITAKNQNNSSRMKAIESGIFYDLLPNGSSVDESTISGLDRSWYDVRFQENWENTGRTMMIISISVPKSVKRNTITLSYTLTRTFESILENGTSAQNDVAFVNTSPRRTPYANISSALSSLQYNSEYSVIQKAYAPLDEAYSGAIGYATCAVTFNTINAFTWGYYKSVKTKTSYEAEDETLPNKEYSYRLSYSQSDTAKSDSIIIYDILENGTNTKTAEWHGTLKNVNISSLTDLQGYDGYKLSPVVYYSTKPRDQFTDADLDVTDSTVWSTRIANIADATAIAIDCTKTVQNTDFVLYGKRSLNVYVTMQAPSSAECVGKSTTNEAIHEARKTNTNGTLSGDPTREYADTTVSIKEVIPVIHKTSETESGTSAEPARVGYDEDLVYTISLTNPDTELTINNTVVTDTIPENLVFDTDDIIVYTSDKDSAVELSRSARVSMTRSGRTLKFTFNELIPNETLYIEIPTVVHSMEARYENTARITNVEGREKIVNSETTYHESKPTPVTIEKRVLSNSEPLPGAKLRLMTDGGKVIAAWTSTGEAKTVELTSGTYTLYEVEAPEEYEIADPITFVVDKTGTINLNEESVEKITMYDRKNHHAYHFSKTWSLVDAEASELTLGITGDSDVTEAEEIAMKANKSIEVKATADGKNDATFTATANASGVITVPTEYKDYTNFEFKLYDADGYLYTYTYTKRKIEPAKPDQITLTASKNIRNGETNTITLDKDNDYKADAEFMGDDTTFAETYPTGWHAPTGNAMKITFDNNFQTESVSYDYLIVYFEKDGKIYQYGKYGGTDQNIRGKTLKIPSNRVYLYWHTDGSGNNYYGFKVTDVQTIASSSDTAYNETMLPNYAVITDVALPESAHNTYPNSDNKLWLLNGDNYLTDEIKPYVITPNGDDYDVEIKNVGERYDGAIGQVEKQEDFNYTISKNWNIETNNDGLMLGITGDSDLTEAQEKELKAGKAVLVTATANGKDEVSFSATANEDGIIAVPNEYKDYTNFAFTIVANRVEYAFAYTVETSGSEIPDTLTIHASGNEDVVLTKAENFTKTVSLKGTNVEFEEVVPNGWTLKPAPTGTAITFDNNFRTESVSYDYLIVYFEKDGKIYQYGKYGGTDQNIRGKTLEIPSNRVYLYWHTDGSGNNYYGFKVTDVQAIASSSDTAYNETTLPNYAVITDVALPESAHNTYPNGDNKLWLLETSGEPYEKEETNNGFNIGFTNNGSQTFATVGSVTATELSQEITVEKEWVTPKSKIAIEVKGTQNEVLKATRIDITDMDNTVLETITDVTGAVVSSKFYDIDKSYKAKATFENGDTKTVTVNPMPFTKPNITVKITHQDGEENITLTEAENWTKTVTIPLGEYTIEETTPGEWTTSYDGNKITNTTTFEIPVTTISTPQTPWIVQTGNDGIPHYLYVIFGSCLIALAAVLLTAFLKKKRIKA